MECYQEMEYFSYICYQINIGCMKRVIQQSLFNDKETFNQYDFEEKCINDTFIKCISGGISTAIDKVASANLPIRLRVKSDSVHDIAFAEIQNAISCSELYDKVHFYSDFSGNKRLWFTYNNYMFILRKSESDGNKSRISDIINSQRADFHVITIEYAISNTWDNVVSVSLQYIRNKVVEMIYYIPVSSNSKMSANINIDNTDNIKDAKATLKIVARKTK